MLLAQFKMFLNWVVRFLQKRFPALSKTVFTFDVIEIARKVNIYLFVLSLRNSTALHRSMCHVFCPVKRCPSIACHSRTNKVEVEVDLLKIIENAFISSFSVPTLRSGYRKTGIFSFDSGELLPEIKKEKLKVKETRKVEPSGYSSKRYQDTLTIL